MWIAWACWGLGVAQQVAIAAASTQQPLEPIAALAQRLGVQLRAASKKKPYILDLTLPNDEACPLGAWLADRLSESLAHGYPELEVVARDRWSSAQLPAELAHDRNQKLAQNEQRARSLGAEVLVQGNFAAIPAGIGITLLASDRLAGGDARIEALGEVPITSEMQAVLTAPLPQRGELSGGFRASIAGVGSPLCEICPPPEYSYVAKTKKLQGVVIAQLWVNTEGAVDNIKVIRTPNPQLTAAAIRTVHNWRFKPARNVQGEFVRVIVDVAVAFRLGGVPPASGPAASTAADNSIAAKKQPDKKF